MALYAFEGQRPQISPATYVHPDAVIIGAATIDAECFIGAGAVIRADCGAITIGRRSNVQENAVLHATPDTTMVIGDGVLIAHGAIIHGLALADGAVIGMGAIVSVDCRLEADAMLGAGSLLPPNKTLRRRVLALGNPAREIRELDDDALRANRADIEFYRRLSARYLEGLVRV